MQLEDDNGGIQRTLVLYRDMAVNSWSALDLTYDPGTGYATGNIADIPGSVEYFVQAVDDAGNVALVLDQGVPYRILSPTADTDGDGLADDVDNCLLVDNQNQADFDGDGLGDACDLNADDDGALDVLL